METSPMHIDTISTLGATGIEMTHEKVNIKIEEMRSEDITLRTEAFELLDSIAQLLDEAALGTHLLPYVRMLLDDEEDVILALIASKIARIVEGKGVGIIEGGIEILEQLLDTEDCVVRDKFLVAKLKPDFLVQNLVPKLDELVKEEQDSIRYNLVDLIVSLSQHINNLELSETNFGPQFIRLGNDPSWRVRYVVANRYIDFCKILSPAYVQEHLIELFVGLVDDLEPEVRASIGQQISGFGNVIGNELALKHLSNCIQSLMEDTSSQVREKLAGHVTLLAPVFGKEKTIDVLLPVFVKLLKDEVPEVRLKLISRLEQVNLVIGVQILAENLLPAILELAADSNWRIRLAVIDEIPALAQHLGKDFFGDKLSLVCCQSWLTDKVYSVRDASIKTFPYLIDNFDIDWTKKYLLKELKRLVKSDSYLYRLTSIKANAIILPCLKEKDLVEEVWSNFFTLLNDPVPNVQFNVSKALYLLSQSFNWLSSPELVCRQRLDEIKQKLSLLSSNDDQDIQYYSKLAHSKF